MGIAEVTRHDGKTVEVRLRCPWCKENTSSLAVALAPQPERMVYVAIAICQAVHCRQPSMVIGHFSGPDFGGSFKDADGFTVNYVFPNDRESYREPGVPEKVAKNFTEALNCYAANLPYGAAVVGRRTLQIALMDKGAPDTTLVEQIKQMPDDVLPSNFKKAAHHVRLVGNDAAHVDEVTGTDADRLLRFVEQVLHQLYVLPYELEQAQIERPIPPQHMPGPAASAPAPQGGGRGKGKS